MDEVRRLESLTDQAINEAKERLAYEVTCLVHGKQPRSKRRPTRAKPSAANKTSPATAFRMATLPAVNSKRALAANADGARWACEIEW